MLRTLGRLIERRPWFVVIVVLIITFGFSLFLPSIEFKTDFNDFMPDDDITKANSRVQDYFGTSQSPMFVLIETDRASSIIDPDAIRDMYRIEQGMRKQQEVGSVISLTTFVNPICLIEFGQTIENCSNDQIQIATNDLLNEVRSGELQIFSSDDNNEEIDYQRFPRLSRGTSEDSADIKNCFINKNNDTITFSIEVYDLSELKEALRPSLAKVNVMEWYLDFENLIKPDERLDIAYRIAAHIEPTHPVWELGKGILENLRNFFLHLRNRELLNSYQMETYLWIKPPEQSTYFPIPLSTGNISLHDNRIDIEISREELGQYGIATQIGTFQLPAKLSNFSGHHNV